MKNLKKLLAVMLSASIVVGMVGCGSKAEETAEEPEETTEEEVQEEEAQEEESAVVEDDGIYSYLTGEPTTEEANKLRPITCMIENTTMALPQYGLNLAGVLYECPVEGGITRMMGVFEQDAIKDQEKIGNVRSCRPYYVFISLEYDAIYVHFGQSIQGETLLNTGIIDDLNGLTDDGTVFYRSSDRSAPHNAYVSGSGIMAGIDKKGYTLNYRDDYNGYYIFNHTPEGNKLENGKDCEVVCPYFYNNKPYFIYNKETGLYERYEFGKPQVDAIDGEQVAVKNIIFKNVPSSIYTGTPYLDIPVNGSGEGKFFTNGKMIDVTWVKETDTSVTHYYDDDANEIELNPGQTWVCLIENQNAEDNKFYETVEEYESR